MLLCITVQHWLELSALSEQHLSYWSVEYLSNSRLYQHETRSDKKEERITENEIYRKAKQEQNLVEKSSQELKRKMKGVDWREAAEERVREREVGGR